MAVVAGIDEAGYGPLLGPLAVSSAAFRVPDDAADGDLWEFFARAVQRGGREASDRVRVADSKALHRNGTIEALERNTLPFVALAGRLPRNVAEYVAAVCPRHAGSLAAYPWYRNRNPVLPREVERKGLEERVGLLRARLAEAGGEFCGARVELLDVREFNREVRESGSKAIPLSRRVFALLAALWQEFGAESALALVDKQGGRNAYAGYFRATFPGRRLIVEEESAGRSEYVVEGDGRRLRVRFEPKADARHMPTALASMLSKYSRELFVEMLNDFWEARVPDLKPTAGYVTDGLRFLKQIDGARRAEGIESDLIRRCR